MRRSRPSVADRERNVLVLDLSKSMLAPLPEPLTEGAERQKIEVARTAVFQSSKMRRPPDVPSGSSRLPKWCASRSR